MMELLLSVSKSSNSEEFGRSFKHVSSTHYCRQNGVVVCDVVCVAGA